jgi:hypothetical protein
VVSYGESASLRVASPVLGSLVKYHVSVPEPDMSSSRTTSLLKSLATMEQEEEDPITSPRTGALQPQGPLSLQRQQVDLLMGVCQSQLADI